MIPSFTVNGLLPPFSGSSPAAPSGRSPYQASIVDVVDRSATTPARIEILDGLLRYRAALHQVGLVDGFQWIDGSFSESIEFLESRPPRDVDIVTFFRRPAIAMTDTDWVTFQTTNRAALDRLFRPQQSKALFSCDAYPVELDMDPTGLVSFTHYWFGLFSHRRQTFEWKGLIEVPLYEPIHDGEARQLLTTRVGHE
jgi:hypothetical protein